MNAQATIAMMPQPAASRAHVLEMLAARRPLFSLPQAFYNDPELFQMDLEAIFYKRWIFAGVECEIPNPGDYFTLSIGPTPVVVLRDKAGTMSLAGGSMKITTEVLSGSPKRVILEEAEAFGADLIVVGSHGHGMVESFLLGSVSQAVALHAKCSVEIVRTPTSGGK